MWEENKGEYQSLGLSIIIMIIEGDYVYQFGYNILENEIDSVGHVRMQGTGAPDFEHVLKQIGGKLINRADDVEAALGTAISCCVGISGAILGIGEVFSDTNLEECFGGWFEIVYCVNNKLVKLTDITYFFWKVTVYDDHITYDFPEVIIKQNYVNDYLLTKAIKINYKDNNSKIDGMKINLTGNMLSKNIDINTINIPPMNSNLICNVFCIRHHLRGIFSISTIEYYQDGNLPYSIDESSGFINLLFNKDYVHEHLQYLVK